MTSLNKSQRYATALDELAAIIGGQTDEVSVLANASAVLAAAFPERFFWTGFYIVRGAELVLGPFQGTVACYKIRRGRGVCGTAWAEARTLVVPDVELFPGHIACSSLSKSEIVVPIFRASSGNRGADDVVAVLDIDSRDLDAFDDVDCEQLERAAQIVADTLYTGE